jgi:hypothetical protein
MPSLRNLSFKNLPREAWLGIAVILLMILGVGTWGVHSLFDYSWLKCLMLAPVFLAVILGLVVLGIYMTM